mmetsp:Transcript_107001/g.271659  ORF Transcript_107001/g.271659 Transcript_107001/m.271659 type:complete len:236 (-) Transcript_107001:92-799(-)
MATAGACPASRTKRTTWRGARLASSCSAAVARAASIPGRSVPLQMTKCLRWRLGPPVWALRPRPPGRNWRRFDSWPGTARVVRGAEWASRSRKVAARCCAPPAKSTSAGAAGRRSMATTTSRPPSAGSLTTRKSGAGTSRCTKSTALRRGLTRHSSWLSSSTPRSWLSRSGSARDAGPWCCGRPRTTTFGATPVKLSSVRAVSRSCRTAGPEITSRNSRFAPNTPIDRCRWAPCF